MFAATPAWLNVVNVVSWRKRVVMRCCARAALRRAFFARALQRGVRFGRGAVVQRYFEALLRDIQRQVLRQKQRVTHQQARR
jgi:hypothetical protein